MAPSKARFGVGDAKGFPQVAVKISWTTRTMETVTSPTQPPTYLPTHPNMATPNPNMVGTYLPTTHPHLVGDGVTHQVMLIDHG